MSRAALKEYARKRNLEQTTEPKGKERITRRKGPQFVVQEHQASTHHYDMRLEIGDVLVSWAVPKGPSTDPHDKRLAMRTEDHPLAYGDFEGVIPEGEYGAGSVIVWDRGGFDNLREGEVDLEKSLDEGKVEVRLHGEKLRGGYLLIRTGKKSPKKSDSKRWLLKKLDDDDADARRNPVSTEPQSVLSGKTIEEMGKEA